MEILQEFTPTRESRSQYAEAIKALVEGKAKYVRLKRGEDFGENISLASVQGAVSQQIRNAGRYAKTFTEKPDALVVWLLPEGEVPKPRKKRARLPAAA